MEQYQHPVTPRFHLTKLFMAPRNNNNNTAVAIGVAVTALAGAIAAGFLLFDDEQRESRQGNRQRYQQQQRPQPEPLLMEEVNIEQEEKSIAKEKPRNTEDDSDMVLNLLQMGFAHDKICLALKKFNYDVDKALEWLISQEEKVEVETASNPEYEPLKSDNEGDNEPVLHELTDNFPSNTLVSPEMEPTESIEPLIPQPSPDLTIGAPLTEVSVVFSDSVYLNPNTPAYNSSAPGEIQRECEDWIKKERLEIQKRLEYLDHLEQLEAARQGQVGNGNEIGPEVPVEDSLIQVKVEGESQSVISPISDVDENSECQETELISVSPPQPTFELLVTENGPAPAIASDIPDLDDDHLSVQGKSQASKEDSIEVLHPEGEDDWDVVSNE